MEFQIEPVADREWDSRIETKISANAVCDDSRAGQVFSIHEQC